MLVEIDINFLLSACMMYYKPQETFMFVLFCKMCKWFCNTNAVGQSLIPIRDRSIAFMLRNHLVAHFAK